MRRLAVYLTLLCVFALALAIGWVLSDAPHWCARIGWCAPPPPSLSPPSSPGPADAGAP
jgi:hypothetical protein